MEFPAAWGTAAATLAAEQWAIVTRHMREAGTMGPQVASAVEMYCHAYARWRLAEAHVAEHGPMVPAPRTGVPMHNPYLSVANAAADLALKIARILRLPAEFGALQRSAGAPGKKEEARERAASAGKVGRFATPPTPPKLIVNNGV